MHVSEDGSVTGSINRAKLAEVEAQSDEAKAQLEQLQSEAKAGEEANARLAEQRQPEGQVSESEAVESETVESEARVSMALSKDELVDRAVDAGLGDRDELQERTKQQLVDDLRASEG